MFSSPLFKAEFGYDVDLHDAIVREVTLRADGDKITAFFVFSVHLPKKGTERPELDYLYSLSFQGVSSFEVYPLIGHDLWRSHFERAGSSWNCRLEIIHDGSEVFFTCESISELFLRPTDQT